MNSSAQCSNWNSPPTYMRERGWRRTPKHPATWFNRAAGGTRAKSQCYGCEHPNRASKKALTSVQREFTARSDPVLRIHGKVLRGLTRRGLPAAGRYGGPNRVQGQLRSRHHVLPSGNAGTRQGTIPCCYSEGDKRSHYKQSLATNTQVRGASRNQGAGFSMIDEEKTRHTHP